MKRYRAIIAVIIILCAALFLAVWLLAPNKILSLKRRATTFYSSLIPHDDTVAKPAGSISFPDLIGIKSTPTPTIAPAPNSYRREGFTHYFQTWNNCGPATLATALSAHGLSIGQQTIADSVKPDADDKNVSMEEMIQYTQEHTELDAVYRMNGTLDLMKHLVSQDYVVILETWFEPKPNDGMGHFRIITGYDDAKQLFSLSDSYNGPKATTSYAQLEKDWQVYGYPYAVFYKKDQEKRLLSLLGSDADVQTNWQNLFARSEHLLGENKDNAYGWFMRGKAQVHLGKHEDAAASFDAARKIGLPWRMLWYQFEIFEAYLGAKRYADVITLSDANIRLASNLEESWYYKAKALEGQGKAKEAADAMSRVTKYNPNYFHYHPE